MRIRLLLLLLGAVMAPSATSAAQAAAVPAGTATAAPAWAGTLDSAVLAEMRRTGTPGAQLAVIVDGRVAYVKAYGVADLESGRPVTDRTLFRVGSVTKMVTAATLTQLAAEGKLDLRAPISRYVPELAGRRVGTVTTHQLLTHSAGWLDNAVAYGRMGEGALGEVMREVSDTLFFTEPSRIYSYSNPGFSMAGYVAEQAAKARFGTLAEDLVLRKLAMPRATFRPLAAMTQDFSQGHVGPPNGAVQIVRPFTENTAQWAAGFLFASATELANLTIALMDGGMFEGRRVLAEEAVRAMTTPHQAIPGTTARYGYGLRVETRDGRRVWQHGGAINGFDAMVVMFPDRRGAVVLFDNRGGAPMRGIVDLAAERALGVPRPAEPAAPAERVGTPEERARVVGRYAMGVTRFEISDSEAGLVFTQGTALPARLVGDDRLVVLPPVGDRITLWLVRGADGRVEYLHTGGRSLARQP